jgi:hypothetical protein
LHYLSGELALEVLKHLVYSLDLGPFRLRFVPILVKNLKGKKFSTTEDAMSAADDWFAAQPSAFYVDGLKKLQQWDKKCVEFTGVL